MTDRQKLLAALVGAPDHSGGRRISVLEVAAMLEEIRADERAEELAEAS
jgi:hypothetical protein